MSAAQRIDQWLYFARLIKSRSQAQAFIESRVVRLNRVAVEKVAATLKPGDVLTLPFERDVRVVRVLALATRRGPADEARALYEEID